MEAPKTLNEYFVNVDNFFRKTFRDDSAIFFAIKTRQYSESVWGQNVFTGLATEGDRAAELATPDVKPSEQAHTNQSQPQHRGTPNSVCLSPRMVLRRDGTALGKMKLSSEVHFPHICTTNLGFALDNAGMCVGFGTVTGLLEGLVMGGRAAVNTIAPASEDVTAMNVQYQRNDFYSGLVAQRNGLGSSNLLFDCGARFFNILVGGGFERQRLSYLEQRNGQEIYDVMYAGVGVTETNWSFAAKLTRAADTWRSARVTFLQKCTASTAVACAYDFDITESRAHVSMGFTQGFRIRVPALISQKESSSSGSNSSGTGMRFQWTTVTPLVLACKVESNGHFAATLRGYFNNCLRWGFVVQRNLLLEGTHLKYGVTLTMEIDS